MWKKFLIGLGLLWLSEKLFGKNKIDCYRKPCWFFFDKTGMIREYRPATDGKDRFFIVADNPFGGVEIDWNSDLGLLARLVYCEADQENYKCKLAVAELVRNRVKYKLYPNDFQSVIFQSGQFGCINHNLFKQFYKAIANNPIEKESFLTSIVVAIKVIYQDSHYFPENLIFFRPDNRYISDYAIPYPLNCHNNFWLHKNC